MDVFGVILQGVGDKTGTGSIDITDTCRLFRFFSINVLILHLFKRCLHNGHLSQIQLLTVRVALVLRLRGHAEFLLISL